jgi:hypothetical protein
MQRLFIKRKELEEKQKKNFFTILCISSVAVHLLWNNIFVKEKLISSFSHSKEEKSGGMAPLILNFDTRWA